MKIIPRLHIIRLFLLPVSILLTGSIPLLAQPETGASLEDAANLAMEEGDLPQAISLFEKSRTRYLGEGARSAAVEVSMGLAICQLYSGEAETSLQTLLTAGDSARGMDPVNDALLADVLALLGSVYNYLGDNEQALQVSLAAAEANLRLAAQRGEELADNYHNLGAIYLARADYAKAAEYERAARNVYLKEANEQAYAETGVNHGLTLLRLGEAAAALEILKESEFLANADFLSPEKRGALYLNLGLTYEELGEWKASRAALRKVLNQADAPQRYKAFAEGNIGLAYFGEGKADSAVMFLQRAVGQMSALARSTSSDLAKLRMHYGQALRTDGQADLALQVFDLAIREQLDLDSNAAIDTLRALSRPCNRRTLLRLLAERAATLDVLGKPEAGLQGYQQAFTVIDRLRQSFRADGSKQFFSGYVMPIYEKSLELAWRLYQEENEEQYLNTALSIAERNKVVLLLESMWEAQLRRNSSLSDSLLDAERNLQIDIAFYERELYNAEKGSDSTRINLYTDYLIRKRAAYDQLKSELEQRFNFHSRMQIQSDYVVDATALQAHARSEGVTLLEYFVGEDAIFVFRIAPEEMEMQRLPRPGDLLSAIAAYRRSISDWNYIFEHPDSTWDGVVQGGQRFFQDWLLPLFPNAMPAKLIIIPDGPMAFIPFEALLTDATSERGNYLSLPYLLHQSEVSYAYSGTLFLKESEYVLKTESANKSAVGLAFAPVYDGEAAPRVPEMALRTGGAALPGAQAEVRALQSHFDVEAFTADLATEARFKQEQGRYRIVHLAMHGILDDEQSAYSYLAFSDSEDSTEDGRLHAYELEQMSLPVQLVVLSACETGTGQLVKGEGVLSLARSFIYAGAESVMMSLWKLEDGATGQMTESFYRNLAAGEGRSSALHQAKLDFLAGADDFSAHPGFWAGMVLIGDTGKIDVAGGISAIWVFLAGGVLLLLLGYFALRYRDKWDIGMRK